MNYIVNCSNKQTSNKNAPETDWA